MHIHEKLKIHGILIVNLLAMQPDCNNNFIQNFEN